MGAVFGSVVGVPGLSSAIVGYDQLCHSHRCRDNVAHQQAGDIRFVVDRHGTKWKCVNRRQLVDEPGDTWGCAELDCRMAKWPYKLQGGFHYEEACNEPYIVSTVDGEHVDDAPEDPSGYDPVEALGKVMPPGCGMAPMILSSPPMPSELRERREKYHQFL
mmetsp:Transcript_78718/g.148521  ORF Transcript_78718/g.148521 Transcript_78718/m.148521 type:complete len:161 (+) Transcript_78718:85-567(+)